MTSTIANTFLIYYLVKYLNYFCSSDFVGFFSFVSQGLTCVLFPYIIDVVQRPGPLRSHHDRYKNTMTFISLYFYLLLLYSGLTLVFYLDIIGVVHGVTPVKTHSGASFYNDAGKYKNYKMSPFLLFLQLQLLLTHLPF